MNIAFFNGGNKIALIFVQSFFLVIIAGYDYTTIKFKHSIICLSEKIVLAVQTFYLTNKVAYEIVKVNRYAVKKTFQYAPVHEKS